MEMLGNGKQTAAFCVNVWTVSSKQLHIYKSIRYSATFELIWSDVCGHLMIASPISTLILAVAENNTYESSECELNGKFVGRKTKTMS